MINHNYPNNGRIRELIEEFNFLSNSKGPFIESDTYTELIETIDILLKELKSFDEDDSNVLHEEINEVKLLKSNHRELMNRSRIYNLTNIEHLKSEPNNPQDKERELEYNKIIEDIASFQIELDRFIDIINSIIELYDRYFHFFQIKREVDREESQNQSTGFENKSISSRIEKGQQAVSNGDEENLTEREKFRRSLQNQDKQIVLSPIKPYRINHVLKKIGGIIANSSDIKIQIKDLKPPSVIDSILNTYYDETQLFYGKKADGNIFLVMYNLPKNEQLRDKGIIAILGRHQFCTVGFAKGTIDYREINDILGVERYRVISYINTEGVFEPNEISYKWQKKANKNDSILGTGFDLDFDESDEKALKELKKDENYSIRADKEKELGWLVGKYTKNYKGALCFKSIDDFLNIKPLSIIESNGCKEIRIDLDDYGGINRVKKADRKGSDVSYYIEGFNGGEIRILNDFKGILNDIGSVMEKGISGVISPDVLEILREIRPDVAAQIKPEKRLHKKDNFIAKN